MKKLSLDLDQLQVESFDTSNDKRPDGTVKAYESTGCGTDDACCQANTWGGRTCDTTCFQILCDCTYGGVNNGTCDAACNSVDCTRPAGTC